MIASTWLLLGESPNAATIDHPRLWLRPDSSGVRHSANRLLEYTGYDWDTFMGMFTRDNLVHRLPRRMGRGRNFPVETARREVKRIFDEHEWCYGFVMLGKRVPRAFTWWATGPELARVPLCHLEYLTWYWVQHSDGRRKPAIIVPHPSGLCRWWNDEDNLRVGRAFFEDLWAGPVIEEVTRLRGPISADRRARKFCP